MDTAPWFAGLREWLAFKVAPWVYVPHRYQRDEAFKRLAEVAYGSRDAIWTSPTTLVHVALEHARSVPAPKDAALRVVVNAYGTKPRHTIARDGTHRDDCIPCGIAALAECFPDNGIAVRVAKELRL